ncbi:MAG TPA: hypothetical protein PK854_11530 [Oscillospiraceae bacterium]|nr:hypothetical protein [Oscillospiraceae bacterium]HPS35883.1 hypothetical protein [Oscillospiraceae bacterium]
MEFQKIAEPCKNFCFMSMIAFKDPLDGRKKLVMNSLAAGRTGILIIADPENAEAGELLEMPGDEGAWALFNLNDEKILVGTCAQKGYLHCLDLKTRSWAKSLSVPGELYIWNLAAGSDGMVYGGTWPGCRLLRYDPEAHTLADLSRASENEQNLYSRMVYGDPYGRIYVSIGYDHKEIRVWDIKSESWSTLDSDAYIREVYPDFIAVDKHGKREYYDLKTNKKIEKDLSGKEFQPDSRLNDSCRICVREEDGTVYGTRGQQYFVLRPGAEKPEYMKLRVETPSTAILELTRHDHKLWGASALGQTIFSYDPETGADWNSDMVCDRGGEVYSIVPIKGKLFMAAYSGGDHIVYDPAQPWNQIENVNPRTVFTAGPEIFIRPSGKSVKGPDGAFWTAWMAPYGFYGGGMTRIDPTTCEAKVYKDLIPGLAFGGLACDERLMYLTTVPAGNGLPEQKDKQMVLCAVNTDGLIERQTVFEKGLIPEPFTTAVVGDKLIVGFRTAIGIYDKNSFKELARIPVETKCTFALPRGDAPCGNEALVFTQRYLYVVDIEKGEILEKALLPVAIFGPEKDPHGMEVHSAVFDEAGNLWFSQHGELFRRPFKA